jgi:hypothetical protein
MRKPIFLALAACVCMLCLGGAFDVAAQTVMPSVRPASVLPASPASNEASASAWSDAQPRDYLMKKAAAFLQGGAGHYISTDDRRLSQGLITQQDVGKTQPTLPEQFNEVFGGVPDPEAILVGNYRLFSACQVHNCGVRAILITDASGVTVQAAGLIHYRCAYRPGASNAPIVQSEGRTSDCENFPTFTIFYQSPQTKNATVTEQMIAWARSKVAKFANATRLGDKANNNLRVEVQFVHGSSKG